MDVVKNFVGENKKIIALLLGFFISPLLALPFCFYFFIKEKERKMQIVYGILISLSFAYLALHTVPLESDDLYRHIENMKILRYTPFFKIFGASYSGVYLNTLVMYLCSKTGIYGLYPAVYVGVGYFLILHNAIRLHLKKKNVIEVGLMVLFMFLCVSCRDYISGLRNYFTFILCGYFIVSEKCFKRDKKLCYIGIALTGFIHTSAFIILFILVLSDLVNEGIWKKIVLGAMCLFLPVSILGCKILLLIPFLKQNYLLNKVHTYFTTPNIININVYLFQLGILVLAILCHLINKRRDRKRFRAINKFFDYYLVFLVAVSPIMLLLTRFQFLLIPLMPILFVQTFDVFRKQWKVRLVIYGILSLFLVAGGLMLAASLRAYPWIFDVRNIAFWIL